MTKGTQRTLKFWESYYPAILSVLLTMIFFFLCKVSIKEKVFSKEIISVVVNIAGILFGFLLTVLALLLQSDSKSLKLIKVYGRFGELIKFNKSAVYSSALSLVLSLIFLIVIDLKPEISFHIYLYDFLKWFWFFILMTTLLKTYRYVDIFYNLIKE